MDGMYALQGILQSSVDKNGEIGLTNKHLLNIVKMIIRINNSDDQCDATEVDIY